MEEICGLGEWRAQAALKRSDESIPHAPEPDQEIDQLRHLAHQQALEIRRLEDALMAFIERSPPSVLRAALEEVAGRAGTNNTATSTERHATRFPT